VESSLNASFRRTRSGDGFLRNLTIVTQGAVMNTPVSKSSENTNWRELYRDAILELNPSKLPPHIAEAERALIERGREL